MKCLIGSFVRQTKLIIALLATLACSNVHAGEVRVAVASNFYTPLTQLAGLFQQDTGHTLKLTSAATSALYSKIKTGSTFDVLLAADDETTKRLVQEQLADANTRFVYAIGRLALWSVQPDLVDSKGAVLSKGTYSKLAIANPAQSPYGVAAKETLTKLAMWNSMQAKLTKGEDVTKTYQLLQSETAELGFVATSQIMRDGKVSQGSWWLVPSSYHKPIRQSAVMLLSVKDKNATQALLSYLKTPKAQAVMQGFGYELP